MKEALVRRGIEIACDDRCNGPRTYHLETKDPSQRVWRLMLYEFPELEIHLQTEMDAGGDKFLAEFTTGILRIYAWHIVKGSGCVCIRRGALSGVQDLESFLVKVITELHLLGTHWLIEQWWLQIKARKGDPSRAMGSDLAQRAEQWIVERALCGNKK